MWTLAAGVSWRGGVLCELNPRNAAVEGSVFLEKKEQEWQLFTRHSNDEKKNMRRVHRRRRRRLRVHSARRRICGFLIPLNEEARATISIRPFRSTVTNDGVRATCTRSDGSIHTYTHTCPRPIDGQARA